ncbi:MAG: LPS export ABC transporter permease LptG [Thermoanaerobaculia bacterium]
MRILTRYIIREMTTPTLLGFGFYTFIILMKTIFELAEMIIRRSLPFSTVLKLLGLSLPWIVVLTIPMSLLFGILIAVGRLSADSEIIAMRASGISTSSIYLPVFLFSFAVFGVNLYLMNVVVPHGNTALQSLKSQIVSSAVEREIKPHVFYDEFDNRVIYVNDVDPAVNLWKGVFVSDRSENGRQKVIVAESGRLSRLHGQVWLDLYNAETHVYSPEKRDRYEVNRNAMQRVLLVESSPGPDHERSRSFREMTIPELVREVRHARSVDDPIDARLASVEIHKKLSIPFACLAFGIVGLPLGITNRRGGKSSGFSLSIGIILFYYVIINAGEDMARQGRMPAFLAMWIPNLALILFGIYLIRRANAEMGRRSRFRFVERFSTFFSRIRARRREARSAEDRPPLLSRLDIAFPNTLDRYILREFTKIMLMVLISSLLLFVIVDYSTEIAGNVTEHKIPLAVVVSYYRYFVIQILHWVLPVSVLLGTVITFGIFSKNNEVTAAKANGISLYRIALPVVIVAALMSLLSYTMLDFVLPYANERVARLKDQIEGKQTARTFSVRQRQWIFGKGRYMFNFLSYDRTNQTLSQVQVFEFDPVSFRLTRRVWAEEARFDGVGWVFVDGWIRSFGDDGTSSYTPIVSPVRLHYPERPEYFALEARKPDQMNYAQLRHYIQTLKSSGYSSDELSVKLYEKTSWPFISLVMALIALPFSFRIGKRGALYGIGIALFLAFIYWTIFGVFTKFGEVGNFPAILSAWSANILFGLAAVYLFLRVET